MCMTFEIADYGKIIGTDSKICLNKIEELKKQGRWEVESTWMLQEAEEESRKAIEAAELVR